MSPPSLGKAKGSKGEEDKVTSGIIRYHSKQVASSALQEHKEVQILGYSELPPKAKNSKLMINV